ncbi:hypothetical protein EDC44_1296 [Cricetibacter osteomyelitidis]|uniref:tRNA A-37 threonylcarbamoyl transferase component Bud32 n=1 Tax=Cricetibacter osteomyelitidis TaxID=1521931 RepID=A0A4R2SRT1_9PAST|nr:protein kinase family protein [Cricetibacter osteomyelitidis]TCP92030.1 hypothetical protein EDC44_1296 [Cricetibacter osteomyelitidis]
MTEFQQYVRELVTQNQGKRIFSFDYNGVKYWIKQPEDVKGVWRLLKPQGMVSFHHELEVLKQLTERQAPIARLVMFDDNFFVLQDAGRTANQWIEDESVSAVQKQQVLNDCATALAELHNKAIIHGRPALRDIAWQNGEVRFLDLESIVHSNNLKYSKMRDVLVFLHGLFRFKLMTDEQVVMAIDHYVAADQQQILPAAFTLLKKLRWIYYLLLPFKPIAKMDLIALYRLFEFGRHRSQI